MNLNVALVGASLSKSKKLIRLYSVWHRIVSTLTWKINNNFFIAYEIYFIGKQLFSTFWLECFRIRRCMHQVNLESVTEWHLIQRKPCFPLKPLLRPRLRGEILQVSIVSIILSLLVKWLPELTVEELYFSRVIHAVDHVF